MERITEKIKREALKAVDGADIPEHEIADALARRICEKADLQFGVLEFHDKVLANVSHGFRISSKWGFGSFYELSYKSSVPMRLPQNCEMGVVLKHAKHSNKLLFKGMTEDGKNKIVCAFEREDNGRFRFVSRRKNFASENALIEILTKILESWQLIYGALWARVMINRHMDLPKIQQREEAAFWSGLAAFLKSDRARVASAVSES